MKKSAAKKAAVKKAAPKAKAPAKTAAKAKAPAKAKPAPRAKAGDTSRAAARAKAPVKARTTPWRNKEAAKPAPASDLPEIPAELLDDAPKAPKPRKPRGKKSEAPKQKTQLDEIVAQLEDSKAEQIVTIPLDEKTAIADAMVIASGRSSRHVGAIADQLVEKLKAAGHRDLRIEGMPQCDWVLVDAGDVVVHIFRPEVRSFYNLEKLLSAMAHEQPST